MLEQEYGARDARDIMGDPVPRPWVAEILGTDDRYEFERRFLHGFRDYSRANSVGSRGIYEVFDLEPGKVYEINEFTSWRGRDRRFSRVSGLELQRITKEEVLVWLGSRSA